MWESGQQPRLAVPPAVGKANETGENKIDLFQEQRFPHSIGLLLLCLYCLARIPRQQRRIQGHGDDALWLNRNMLTKSTKSSNAAQTAVSIWRLDYFDFHHSNSRSYSNKFLDLFGENRPPDLEFFTMKTNPERSAEKAMMDRNQYYADVAASIQQVTEDALIDILKYLHEKTGHSKLVMAGGVALNTKANWRLLNETPFEEIYIQPASGDDGGALGAALWAHHIVLGKPRNWVMPHAYWGEEYSDAECRAFLDNIGANYTSYDDDVDKMLDVIADEMTNENIVGFFQGRFEWGPRALGNRSILADPRSAEMKEVVNHQDQIP